MTDMEFEISRVENLTVENPYGGGRIEIPLHCYSPNWLDNASESDIIKAVMRGLIEVFISQPSVLVRLGEPLYMLSELLRRMNPNGKQRKAREGFRASISRPSIETETKSRSKKNRKD